jgi:hypothetical protein
VRTIMFCLSCVCSLKPCFCRQGREGVPCCSLQASERSVSAHSLRDAPIHIFKVLVLKGLHPRKRSRTSRTER